MSKIDKSLEEFDIIKLLFFFLFFVFISMGLILGLVVPDIKEYKHSKNLLLREESTTTKVGELLKRKEEELNSLRVNNRKIIESFMGKFSEENFTAHAKSFFEKVKLEKIEDGKELDDEFVLYELKVTSKLKTPTQFYDFLESLNGYETVVRTDFPIQIWIEDEKLNAVFNIKTYELK
ncbi:MAG: hypothetical protein M0P02_00445 [Sulfurospirillaceae bacterium]|nr:hypothetical protein [Sulfurospirillaceae bacterium]MCK9545878.1 hypothetical protein [Sulfurospirillaceae bacterium]MDY0237685.1 hypothetical protein [Campylobacterales bacterium]